LKFESVACCQPQAANIRASNPARPSNYSAIIPQDTYGGTDGAQLVVAHGIIVLSELLVGSQ
jgi:hypothetical protein